MVGNGAEGEPASSKDRSLLWICPHLVLDGLQLAAGAAGSPHGRAVRAAQRAAARPGWPRPSRSGPPPGMDAASVEVVTAPGRFLAGEESALASRLAGRPALPAYRPVRGLPRLAPGRAALVQNVETLAHLALIARYGAAWFRRPGTAAEPGTHAGHPASGRRPDQRGRGAAGHRPGGPARPGCRARAPGRARPGRAERAEHLRPGPGGARRRVPRRVAARRAGGAACRWPTRRCARSARPSGPGCWPPCPPAGAASPRPRGWPGTWPWNRPASAARASTACRASPPPWSISPGRAPTAGRGPTWSAGPAWSPAAAPATTRTAACGSSAARCGSSRPRPGCTSRGGAAARTRARSCRCRLPRATDWS